MDDAHAEPLLHTENCSLTPALTPMPSPNSPVTMSNLQLLTSNLCNPFSFTLLSKNASANHLESHSCKNKGLKVPCFHTLTKKGVGEGGLFGSGHRSRAPYASPDSCRDGSPVTSHNSRPRALRVPLLPSGFSIRRPTSDLEPLFFACAPRPPDSRFSALLGAIGATASIDGIVVAAAPRRGGGAFAKNRRNAMTAILAIANQKGGVGKTTTAINLAAAIAQRGKKTLLIDLDPQANTTIAFFEQDEIQTTMFDVLGDHRAEMAAIIKPSKDPLLFVAPGRLALAKLEQQLAGQFDAPFKLKDALTPLLKDYEYIVMDTDRKSVVYKDCDDL